MKKEFLKLKNILKKMTKEQEQVSVKNIKSILNQFIPKYKDLEVVWFDKYKQQYKSIVDVHTAAHVGDFTSFPYIALCYKNNDMPITVEKLFTLLNKFQNDDMVALLNLDENYVFSKHKYPWEVCNFKITELETNYEKYKCLEVIDFFKFYNYI